MFLQKSFSPKTFFNFKTQKKLFTVFALFENLVRLKDEKKTKTTRESFMALLAYLRIYLLKNNVAFIHRLNPIPEGERFEWQTFGVCPSNLTPSGIGFNLCLNVTLFHSR